MEKSVTEIIADYEERIGHELKVWSTPGIPGKVLSKYNDEGIDTSDYRSFVG